MELDCVVLKDAVGLKMFLLIENNIQIEKGGEKRKGKKGKKKKKRRGNRRDRIGRLQAMQTNNDSKQEHSLLIWDSVEGSSEKGESAMSTAHAQTSKDGEPFDFFNTSPKETSLLLQPPVSPLIPRKYDKGKLKETFETFKITSNKHFLSIKEKNAL